MTNHIGRLLKQGVPFPEARRRAEALRNPKRVGPHEHDWYQGMASAWCLKCGKAKGSDTLKRKVDEMREKGTSGAFSRIRRNPSGGISPLLLVAGGVGAWLYFKNKQASTTQALPAGHVGIGVQPRGTTTAQPANTAGYPDGTIVWDGYNVYQLAGGQKHHILSNTTADQLWPRDRNLLPRPAALNSIPNGADIP